MWTIENPRLGKSAELPRLPILTFGSDERCEVRIPNAKASIALQLVVDGDFVFVCEKETTRSCFGLAPLQVDGETMLVRKEVDLNAFSQREISQTELTELYQSADYKRILRTVQTREGSALQKLSDGDEKSIHIIRSCLQIVDEFFWNAEHPSREVSRKRALDLVWSVWAQMCAFGLITHLLADASVSEVMVNEPGRIFIERQGRISLTELRFENDEEMLGLVERIAAKGGRRIDQCFPYCDTHLPDGSRVHAIIPPLALQGPCLTIRKFPTKRIKAETLIELGSVHPKVLEHIDRIVSSRSNVLISGGTGSGKTTLLNVLSSFIPSHERVITIEDSAELQLQQPHVIRLESRIPNVEGKGEVTLRDLVKNALRMRPDRIIVGECRSGEALDMLQAMNTGHDGSMTTTHANSPIDALRRVETLVLFSGLNLPSRAIREQIASAIHYVVQQTRFVDGKRRVSAVHQVVGIDDITHQFVTKSLVEFDPISKTWSGEWVC